MSEENRERRAEDREMFGPPPPMGLEQLDDEATPAPAEAPAAPKEKAAKGKKRKLVFLPNRKRKKAQQAAQQAAQGPAPAPGPAPGPGGRGAAAPARKGKKKKKKNAKNSKNAKKKGKKAKGKGPMLLVILAVVVLILLGALVFLIVKLVTSGEPGADAPPEESQSEPVESDEPGEGGEPAEPTPTPTPTPRPPMMDINQRDAYDYISKLPPGALGLEGEDMAEYQISPSEKLVKVDGIPCVEVYVYSDANPTGTNAFMGKYCLTRSAPRRLFQVDEESGKAVELILDSVKIETAPPAESPAPAEGEEQPPEGTAEEGGDGQNNG